MICQDCDEDREDVEITTCPYDSEINDRFTEIQVCKDCYIERLWAI